MNEFIKFMNILYECNLTTSYNKIMSILSFLRVCIASIHNETNKMMVLDGDNYSIISNGPDFIKLLTSYVSYLNDIKLVVGSVCDEVDDILNKATKDRDYDIIGKVYSIPKMAEVVKDELDACLLLSKLDFVSENSFEQQSNNLESMKIITEDRIDIHEDSILRKQELEEGMLVKHKSFGVGKICSLVKGSKRLQMSIQFNSGAIKNFNCTDDTLMTDFELLSENLETEIEDEVKELGTVFEESFILLDNLSTVLGNKVAAIRIGTTVYPVTTMDGCLGAVIQCGQELMSSWDIVRESNEAISKYKHCSKPFLFLSSDELECKEMHKIDCNGIYFRGNLDGNQLVAKLKNLQIVLGTKFYLKLE